MSPNELDQLVARIADAVIDRLANGTADRALDVYGVAALLGCSVPTVERMVASDEIPSFKVNRLRRFDPADVLAALKAKGGCDHGE